MGFEQFALFGVIREPPLATVTAGERAVMFQRRKRLCECGTAPLKGRKFCQACAERREAEAEERKLAASQAVGEERNLKAERTRALHAEIRKLRAQGFATRAIAGHLGTSHRMVVRVGLADPATGRLPR